MTLKALVIFGVLVNTLALAVNIRIYLLRRAARELGVPLERRHDVYNWLCMAAGLIMVIVCVWNAHRVFTR